MNLFMKYFKLLSLITYNYRKCRENEAVYPSIGLGNSMKLEQLTAYWTWSRFNKILIKLRVELKSLKVSTPNLQQQLQNLLYAYGLNLTEHRIMVTLFSHLLAHC